MRTVDDAPAGGACMHSYCTSDRDDALCTAHATPEVDHGRRTVLLAGALSLVLPVLPQIARATSAIVAERFVQRIRALEGASGGRLGVCLVRADGAMGASHRGDERFLMCSTFKVVLVASVLRRVELGLERLDRRVALTHSDVVTYSPVTEHAIGQTLSIAQLCAAALTISDNTAANLLLRSVGGPAQLTAFMRSVGDAATRLDRIETVLNAPAPGTNWDTTTPDAMAALLATLLYGSALRADSRRRLRQWMRGATTGLERLRRGVPVAWQVGDKTGTGPTTFNDVAWIEPPRGTPWLVAMYYGDPPSALETRNAVAADVGRAAVEFIETAGSA